MLGDVTFGGTGAEAAGIGGRGRPRAAAICAANAICCWADEAGTAGPAPAGLDVDPRLSGVGVRALKTYNIYDKDAICVPTLQSVMNAKHSKHRFWHCHENGLIKTIQTILHNL